MLFRSVVQLTNSSGTVTKTYNYDAFGVEKNPDSNDANPFRYCGEYFDSSSGTYYLRGRQAYDPRIGRFTQSDPHWNPANMIYGDNPLKLNSYTYMPSVAAMKQSGNLYAYCVSNPVKYKDPTGMNAGILESPSFGDLISESAKLLPWVAGIAGTVATTIAAAPTALIAAVGVAGLVGSVANQIALADTVYSQIRDIVDIQTALGLKEIPGTHSVYVIRDRRTSENYNKVVYVGRTGDYYHRQKAHQLYVDRKSGIINYPEGDFSMQIVLTGLTYEDSRLYEQGLICAYTLQELNNAINSISPKKWDTLGYSAWRIANLLSGFSD